MSLGLCVGRFYSKPVVFKLKACTHTPVHTTATRRLSEKKDNIMQNLKI